LTKEVMSYGRNFGAGSIERGVVAQPCNNLPVVCASAWQANIRLPREPYLTVVWERESRWKYTNNSDGDV